MHKLTSIKISNQWDDAYLIGRVFFTDLFYPNEVALQLNAFNSHLTINFMHLLYPKQHHTHTHSKHYYWYKRKKIKLEPKIMVIQTHKYY